VPSNIYVVNGNTEVKQLTDLLPGILNQLGPESMDRLRKYAESLGVGAGTGTIPEEDEEEEDDDDVPDLVENFEEAAAK
jgi:nascent polypeptide-associated complex subunit beta